LQRLLNTVFITQVLYVIIKLWYSVAFWLFSSADKMTRYSLDPENASKCTY